MLASCWRAERQTDPLHLVAAPEGRDSRVSLLAGPGLLINARLAPALELRDGSILRFDIGRRTADSAYFAEPPSARLAGRHRTLHGTLRASVCHAHEQVCRAVTMEL